MIGRRNEIAVIRLLKRNVAELQIQFSHENECMREANRTTILLVDDHDLVRTGLKLSLEQRTEFRIVGDAFDGPSAIKKVLELRPNVVLMDIGLPGMDGVEATWQIKQSFPECRVLMLTSHDSEADILASLGAGADGFCRKDVSVEELARAIMAVDGGKQWLEPSIAQQLCRSNGGRQGTVSTSSERSKQSIIFEREIDIMRQVERSYEYIDPEVPSTVDEFIKGIKNPPIPRRISNPGGNNSGKTFADKYSLESSISEGGMGIVYKARHLDMDKVVAIKILKEDLAIDRRVLRWFHQEAKAASSLSHPNVISVFDFGVTETGQPFLVMDYIDGENLDQILVKEGGLELNRFLKMFFKICDGLSMAHSMNIIHCDLKPSNIMLLDSSQDEDVKIVDFGLSKIIPRTASVDTQMTDRFEVAGSPLYMSPEQCLGQKMDFRSDIYALGCVMYEAITGHPVFDTQSPFETFGCQLRETPKHFVSICPDKNIPYSLESIVFKTFNKDPEHRYQSVMEVKQDLMNVFASSCV
jgi:serine/threonine protein kinase/CheY-like chemotaxis protein